MTCTFCGERSLADALLNMVLFIPFGYGLARSGVSFWRVILIGAVFSAAIELTQWVVPGRDPNVADIVSNTTGAALAFPLYRWMSSPQWQFLLASRYVLLAAVGAPFAILALAAWLLTPSFSRERLYGQWTPQFENVEHYTGCVLAVRVGPRRIFNTVIADPRVGDYLLGGIPLRVRFQAGAAPRSPAPVFNIFDESAREMISIAAVGDKLLIRFRTRSATFLLNTPVTDLSHALAQVRAGDTVHVQLQRIRGGFCAYVNQKAYCPTGYTAGRTFGAFMQILSSQSLDRLLGLIWLGVLFLPAGLLAAHPGKAILVALAALAGFAALPHAVALLPSPLTEFLAVLGGICAGVGLRRWNLKRAQQLA